MADGDIIHSQLSWRYQEPYQELCERKLVARRSPREGAELIFP